MSTKKVNPETSEDHVEEINQKAQSEKEAAQQQIEVEVEGPDEVADNEGNNSSDEPNDSEVVEGADELNALKQQLEQSQKEAQEYKDQFIRMQAEFANFRKRKEKEMGEMIRFANEDLIKILLPILDNFDRTLDAIEKTDNLAAVKEGIELVDASMKRSLEKVGLQPIDCKDQSFDPAYHEAISSLEVEEEDKKGKILDEVEKGYLLKDKVIRFSKVIVAE